MGAAIKLLRVDTPSYATVAHMLWATWLNTFVRIEFLAKKVEEAVIFWSIANPKGNEVKKFMERFRYGEKGFTLIELLVVVAILGILAAVAIPNIGRFMNTGQQQAADSELHNVQTAVMAAMADAGVGTIPGGDGQALDDTTDLTVSGNISVGDFIVGYGIGGNGAVHGTYTVDADGTVNQTAYP